MQANLTCGDKHLSTQIPQLLHLRGLKVTAPLERQITLITSE